MLLSYCGITSLQRKKMLILVNGLPLFSKNLVERLNEFDTSNKYVFVDTYYSFWGKIKFLLLLPFAKLFISFNGVYAKSGSLDKVIKRKIPIMMYWHGSDALLAKEKAEKGDLYLKYIQYSHHFSDAPWLLDKLKDILPNREVLPFKTYITKVQRESFSTVQVLTYVPKGKEDFYGLPILLEWAKQNLKINVNVIGHDGAGQNARDNVKFLGWVSQEEAEIYYQESPIFVRLTAHDGNSLSVTQALGYGARVVWTQPHSHCTLVDKSIESFGKVMTDLLSDGDALLTRDEKNIKFVEQNYSPKTVIPTFVKTIKNVIEKK